jgi:predicted Zn-dependent protease with MMP-like domain
MDRAAFEALVDRALEDLPRVFVEALKNIHVVVEDAPSFEDLESVEMEPGETLFGLYQGIPLPNRGSDYGNVLPDRISIYQEPIESVCRNRDEILREVRITVFHELGHYFGMSDDEMEALEEGGG